MALMTIRIKSTPTKSCAEVLADKIADDHHPLTILAIVPRILLPFSNPPYASDGLEVIEIDAIVMDVPR